MGVYGLQVLWNDGLGGKASHQSELTFLWPDDFVNLG